MTLTAKQERFVQEYAVDLNATQAAIRAGYSEKTAYSIGHENLTKPEIVEAIEASSQKVADKVELTAELVLNGLLDIAMNGEREANRVRSWELLGKHLALFADRLEVTNIDLAAATARVDLEIERLSQLHDDHARGA